MRLLLVSRPGDDHGFLILVANHGHDVVGAMDCAEIAAHLVASFRDATASRDGRG